MEAYTKKIINRMGRLFEGFGVNPITGRIFGCLISSEEPKPLTEIAGVLELSKAAISIHIRVLEQMGYCDKLAMGSDRQHYYTVSESYLVNSYLKRIESERMFLRDLKKLMSSGEDENSIAHKRLESLYNFTDFMIGVQKKSLDEWEKDHC